jgi:hypothetical protein
MTNKIIGYALLIAGLMLIVFTLYQSYNIFMGNSSAPLVFKVQEPLNSSETSGAGNLQDLQKQLNEEIAKRIGQMLPVETLSKVLNLLSWSTLAWLFVFGGAQISTLGVKMIK